MVDVPWSAPEGTTGLIFDCDGTLADTMPIHFVAWTAMLHQHGLSFPETQFFAFAGMPSHRIIDRLAAEQGRQIAAADVTTMVADKEHRYIAQLDEVVAVPAVLEVAARHRGVLPMAVASGGEGWVVRRTLEVIGALDWFDTVVGSEDTARHKPEPDVFLEAARRLGVRPEGCVVFEDSDLGLEAAQRAGMAGVDIREWLGASQIERVDPNDQP
ncbi:MAG: family phosphatase [Acidimicrobiales bacterium]|nr:family phosphatase [Acidimicrobiales bacterium]